MEKIIAGVTVNVTEEGYLTNFSQWTKEIGNANAIEQGVDMTATHWEVVDWIQSKFEKEEALSIRSVKSSGIVDIKQFYALFPEGPLKKATLIAGIPKPKSCI